MTHAILITRPNHDVITTYLFYWSGQVIKEAQRKGIKVLDLQSVKANSQDFASYIKEHKPFVVFFNGHGNSDAIYGYNDDCLVEANKNENLLIGKVVYARSCDSANNLGRICIEKGTLTFIGYRKNFVLGYSSSMTTKPLNDPIAKLFMEPSNLVPISLIKGNIARDAYRKSQAALLRNLAFMLSTRATPNQKDAAPYLWANWKHQVLLGDETASY